MKISLRNILVAASALSVISPIAAFAQSVAPIQVTQGSGTPLCAFKIDGTNYASCQVKYTWNGSAWVLAPSDTSGRPAISAPTGTIADIALGGQIDTDLKASIPAGANVIGKMGIDQSVPGTSNAVVATNFPATVLTNSGVTGANSPRLTVAQDTSTLAGSPAGFAPTGQATLTAGTATSNVALGSAGPVALVTNNGTGTAFVNFGAAGVTATTSSYPINAGQSIAFNVGSNGFIAGITSSGSNQLSITTGTGLPAVAGGGSSGGGTVAQGTGNSTNGWYTRSQDSGGSDATDATNHAVVVEPTTNGRFSTGSVSITSNAVTPLVPALGSNLYAYITDLDCNNASPYTYAGTVFNSASQALYSFIVPSGGPFNKGFQTPLAGNGQMTSNTALSVQVFSWQGPVTISSVSYSGSTVTLTLSANAPFVTGQWINVSGLTSGGTSINGIFQTTSVSAATVQYTVAGAVSASGAGTTQYSPIPTNLYCNVQGRKSVN